jgi:hypothetical protein
MKKFASVAKTMVTNQPNQLPIKTAKLNEIVGQVLHAKLAAGGVCNYERDGKS